MSKNLKSLNNKNTRMRTLASLVGILRQEKKRVGKLSWHRNLMLDTRPFNTAQHLHQCACVIFAVLILIKSIMADGA